MLFALDWMKEMWNAIAAAVQAFTENLNLLSISAAMNAFWPVLATWLIAGTVLCMSGFRYHKIVHGIAGGILLGTLGWHIGRMTNGTQIAVSVIYAVILMIAGFFIFYLCFFINILAGSYFLFTALMASFKVPLKGTAFWLAALAAIIYCAIYIKYKLAMTAVTGASILGLVFFGNSPLISFIVFCGCIPAGIYLQTILCRRYEKQRIRTMQEQVEKYPYGPGLAYGWPDPTLSHKSKDMEKKE